MKDGRREEGEERKKGGENEEEWKERGEGRRETKGEARKEDLTFYL